MEKNDKQKNDSGSLKNYFALGEVFTYFFRKKDPNNKPDVGLRMMHGVNKFSIIVFILGVIFIIVRRAFFQS